MDHARSLLGALALAGLLPILGGCTTDGEAPTFGVPMATLAPVRLVPCPARTPAAAEATRCPEESR